MKTIFYSWHAFFQRRYRRILLTVFLFTCSIVGFLCARDSQVLIASLMRGCFTASVSIVCSTFIILLPFFAVILAALYNRPIVMAAACVLKVFSFVFSTTGILMTYPSSGFLVCGLLMFTDTICVFLLLRLTIRYINGFPFDSVKEILRNMVLLIGISVLEKLYITPFLTVITQN